MTSDDKPKRPEKKTIMGMAPVKGDENTDAPAAGTPAAKPETKSTIVGMGAVSPEQIEADKKEKEAAAAASAFATPSSPPQEPVTEPEEAEEPAAAAEPEPEAAEEPAAGDSDEDGADDDGADEDGADEDGADDDGADEDGADEDGADDDGADDDGADEDGSDEDGSDEDGSDEDGADEDGSDEDGSDEDGSDDDDEPDTRPALYLAEFDTPGDLLHAAEQVRDAGYQKWDCHTPYAIHGMDQAMGLPPTKIGIISFIAGMTGIVSAFLLMHYTNSWDYPIIIGGKPVDAFPPMGPIIFELGILLCGLATLFGLLGLAGLPRHNHPVFESERFAAATDDKFFISIEVEDEFFDLEKTKSLLESTHPSHLELIEETL